MDKVKVSICVVTHNNEDEILNLIDSIVENTQKVSFKVYLVDNNSSDRTVQIVKNRHKNVEIILNTDNIGFGAAHNKVVSLINSDYHIVINPDINFCADVISELCDFMDKNGDVAIVTPKVLSADGSQQYLPKKEPKFRYILAGKLEKFFGYFANLRDEYTMKNCDITKPTEIDFCTGCFMLIRTSIFRKLHGFDDRFFMYFEDADLSKRAKNYGKIIFNPSVAVTHSWHRDSAKKLKFLFIHIASMLKYFKKWC